MHCPFQTSAFIFPGHVMSVFSLLAQITNHLHSSSFNPIVLLFFIRRRLEEGNLLAEWVQLQFPFIFRIVFCRVVSSKDISIYTIVYTFLHERTYIVSYTFLAYLANCGDQYFHIRMKIQLNYTCFWWISGKSPGALTSQIPGFKSTFRQPDIKQYPSLIEK